VSGDIRRLLAMAAAGAVIGPVALAWGLQRTSGTSASLMLTLEALFTAVLAWRMYHETMGPAGVDRDVVAVRRVASCLCSTKPASAGASLGVAGR
jgi:hypothetical protein